MYVEKQTSSSIGEETEGARRATGVSSPRLELSLPNPEVVAKKARRRFTKSYKLNILEKADKCSDVGDLGALLRREGLYSSQLSLWRTQRRDGFFKEIERRGRPGLSENERTQRQRIIELEKRVQSLEGDLEKASAIIDIQKKLCDLLGLSPEKNNGKTS